VPRSGLLHGSHCLWTLGGFRGGETAPDMETPLGAPAEPRGRFRVGWRGGSQLLQSHYDIDEIVTSQAEISGESSQNCQIGAQAPTVPGVLEEPAAERHHRLVAELSTVLSTSMSTDATPRLWTTVVEPFATTEPSNRKATRASDSD